MATLMGSGRGARTLRSLASTPLMHRLRLPSKKVAAGTVVASAFTAAWYYRPIADKSGPEGGGPDRSNETFCSASDPPSLRSETPILLSVARGLSIGATTLAIRVFMNTYGRYDLDTNDPNYVHFLDLVLGSAASGRMENQGILTVSNHRSTFDDPGVVSCILPLWMGIQPKYNRFGICSQEYCFNDALPGLIKGYIGAGQVLPICRGAGVDQKLLRDFARHLAAGEWCHVFPEGGVWQLDELGGRRQNPTNDDRIAFRELALGPKSQRGKLKWGVGKLVAHAPVRPRIVPFAHAGMENLLPQDPDTGRTHLKRKLFLSGDPLRVRIKFGREVFVDDLIEEHERVHGRLWTYDASPGDGGGRWRSSRAERELYHRIALRIEGELERLTGEVVVGPPAGGGDGGRGSGDRQEQQL